MLPGGWVKGDGVARALDWPWQDIATALHVSRQAVHEKHVVRRKAAAQAPGPEKERD